jgi:16S rRNA (guanine1516-N2)-methyltransferase
MTIPPLAILPQSESFTAQANLLAEQLNLPLLSPQNPKSINVPIVIIVGENGIGLQECGKNAAGAVYVDFASGAAEFRRKKGGEELIAKAIGLKSLKNPYVLDATAGLGRDGFVMASLGAKVHMVERSPIIFALLEDGIKRALQNAEIKDIAARILLNHANAVEFLRSMLDEPDVIYLDPMFPEREKSSLVKKEMRIFKSLIGKDEDSAALLEPALAKAKYRVVVKRPRLAPTLTGLAPSVQFEGKSSRFDVYVKAGIRNLGTRNQEIS